MDQPEAGGQTEMAAVGPSRMQPENVGDEAQEAKIAGPRLNDENADEFMALLGKKRAQFDKQENAIRGSEYKSDKAQISRKSTISIRLKGLDNSAKKSQAGKSGNFSQILSTKVNTFKDRHEEGDAFAGEGQQEISFSEIVSRYADGRDKLFLYGGLFCAFLFGASFPAFIFLFGELVDELGVSTSTMNYDFGKLDRVCALTVLLAAVVVVVSGGQVVLTSHFADSITYKMSVAYFGKCLEKDAAFYDKTSPQKVADKLKEEIKIIRQGLGENQAYVVQSFTVFVLGFVLAFVRGWLFTLMLLPGFPIIIGTGLMLAQAMSRRAAETAKSYAQCMGLSTQAIKAIKLVQAYGNEAVEAYAYKQSLDKNQGHLLREVKVAALSIGLIYFLFYLFYAYSLFLGGRMRVLDLSAVQGDRTYTGGQVLCIMMCVILGSFDLGTVITHFRKVREGKRAARSVLSIIDTRSADDAEGELAEATASGDIKFSNVTFEYPGSPEKTVLREFSQVFETNKSTAIFGEADADTSAIIKLLERFYDVQQGEISIGGQDIKDLNRTSLRRLIGYVGRDPSIFKGTIRDNMRMAKPEATDEEMKQVLEDVGAWNFLKSGLDTTVGDASARFSGGQLQQIAVARAFIKKPKILLLDEATSAMDQAAVEALLRTISSYRETVGGLTVVIVAFRIVTFKTMNKIITLRKDGTMGPVGTHEDIMNQYPDSAYAKYCLQLAGSESARRRVQVKMTDIEQRMAANIGGLFITPTKDAQQRLVDVEVDAAVVEKMKQAHARDRQDDRTLAEVKARQAQHSFFQKIYEINRGSPGLIALAFACCVVSGVVLPVFGILFSELIFYTTENHAIFGVDYEESVPGEENLLCGYVAIVALVLFLAIGLRFYAFGRLAQQLTYATRAGLYRSILHKDQSFFENPKFEAEYLTGVLQDDTEILNGASIEKLGPWVEGAFSLVAAIVISAIFCWQQMIVCILCLPVLVVCSRAMWKYQKGLTSASFSEEAAELSAEMIANAKTVQSFGHVEKVVEKYEGYLKRSLEETKQANLWIGVFFGLAEGIFIFVFAVLFYFGGYIIRSNPTADGSDWEYDAAELFIPIFATVFAGVQAGTSEFFGPDTKAAREAVGRVGEILDHASLRNPNAISEEEQASLLSAKDVKGKIEFRDVWFRHPNDRDHFVLRGVSFVIEPNESVAFVGEFGSGKSTIASLLLRFYDPDSGAILLDDQNIQAYKLHELRQQLSLVLQQPLMFNNSLLENILYGNLSAKNSEIRDAAETANCEDFLQAGRLFQWDFTAESIAKTMQENRAVIVERIGEQRYKDELAVLHHLELEEDEEGVFNHMPIDHRDVTLKDSELGPGYRQQVGADGCRLSMDQKQRVSIARALVFKPKVLLVDDAILGYNEGGERKVRRALETAMEENTAILFTERANYASSLVNKLFVVEHGRIVEEGSFKELEKRNGPLARLIMNE